ncbi:MAG: hypothetical protein VX951_03400 [Planctomycetota bacterium]|nr:hypothetical protein [Planctomycetota bacterium]
MPYPLMTHRRLARVVISASLLPAGAAQATKTPQRSAWEPALEWCEARLVEFRGDLEAAHATLLARVETESPNLLARLRDKKPAKHREGYGLLPEINRDLAYLDVPLQRSWFRIEWLSTNFVSQWRDGFALRQRCKTGKELEALCNEYLALRRTMQLMSSNVSYHRYWQKAIPEYHEFFARRNALLPKVEELQKLLEQGGDAKRIEAIRAEVQSEVAPFQKTPGLKVSTDEDGWRVLRVEVVTDITDETFLKTFEAAVDREYTQSAVARAKKFRIELSLQRMSPARLYPDGVPALASVVDIEKHVARFPKGALVLTTGARSTHAFNGRYIQLGTNRCRPRTLAHEFGHLLGFSDAYLRCFTGKSTDPLGCSIMEWTGLLNDLMGEPEHGRVTSAMLDRLLSAYQQ